MIRSTSKPSTLPSGAPHGITSPKQGQLSPALVVAVDTLNTVPTIAQPNTLKCSFFISPLPVEMSTVAVRTTSPVKQNGFGADLPSAEPRYVPFALLSVRFDSIDSPRLGCTDLNANPCAESNVYGEVARTDLNLTRSRIFLEKNRMTSVLGDQGVVIVPKSGRNSSDSIVKRPSIFDRSTA